MKEKELRKVITCSLCGKKAPECGVPLFYRVRIERWGIDLGAVRRQSGLELMFGGTAGAAIALAQAMGADEDMAHHVMDPVAITVCETCSHKSHPLGVLVEAGISPVLGEIRKAEEQEKEEVAE
jgi:hypothetical protein